MMGAFPAPRCPPSPLFMLNLLLVAAGFVLIILTVKPELGMMQSRSDSDLLPFNQLERGHMSRSYALSQLVRVVKFYQSARTNEALDASKNTDPEDASQSGASVMLPVRDIILGMGLGDVLQVEEVKQTVDRELSARVGTTTNGDRTTRSDQFTRKFVIDRFCYDTSRHTMDPSFCPRLLTLLEDIRRGVRPALLTLFTWLGDQKTDTERLSRRVIFQNWSLLSPFIQTVVFTDSRPFSGLANLFNWPSLPVPEYNPDGVPVFRSMVQVVYNRFNSTFYGYVHPTTMFDVSILETVMALKQLYTVDDELNKNPVNLGTHGPVQPVLVYGTAMCVHSIVNILSLAQVNELATGRGNFTWSDWEDSLVYFLYSGVDFNDIPSLIVDDKLLIPFVLSRSSALGHVVVDASDTILSLHYQRDKTSSEWGRELVRVKPRNPHYNERLAGEYLESLGYTPIPIFSAKVFTKFAKNGSVEIDIKR